jgi:hypothetical protein
MRGFIRIAGSPAVAILAAVLALMIGGLITMGTYRLAEAQTVSSSEVAATANPSTDQVDSVVIETYHSAPMVLLLIFALYGVSRFVLWLDSRRQSDTLAKLRPYIVTVTSILGGVIISLSMVETIDLKVMLGALAAAVALELKSKPAPKTEQRPPSADEPPMPLPPARVVS